MTREVGDKWLDFNWSGYSYNVEETSDPPLLFAPEEFNFLSEEPRPLLSRTYSGLSDSFEDIDTVFQRAARKQVRDSSSPFEVSKRQRVDSPISVPQETLVIEPSPILPLVKKDKTSKREQALIQFQALLKYDQATKITETLMERYVNAINEKFPGEFNSFMSLKTALKRYEHKYKKPCPDVSLDPEIEKAFNSTGLTQDIKKKAVGLIKACLSYKPHFALQNYIDIACHLLEVDAAKKDEILNFNELHQSECDAIPLTPEMKEQIDELTKEMISDTTIDELAGQYAALKKYKPAAIDNHYLRALAEIYKDHFQVQNITNKIRVLIQDRQIEKVPELKVEVKQAFDTIVRNKKIGPPLALNESQILLVVGHIKSFLEYLPNPNISIEKHLELAKSACGISLTIYAIKNYYDQRKKTCPPIPLSTEVKAKLDQLKKEADEAESLRLNRDQAIEQYGALLHATHSKPSLTHIKHFNIINNKWPNVFTGIDVLRTAYRRYPKDCSEVSLDPDIKKVFFESSDAST